MTKYIRHNRNLEKRGWINYHTTVNHRQVTIHRKSKYLKEFSFSIVPDNYQLAVNIKHQAIANTSLDPNLNDAQNGTFPAIAYSGYHFQKSCSSR